MAQARAPLPTLRDGRDPHFDQLIREAAGNALDGRRDVCVTNLTHAIQVLLGVDEHGPQAVPDDTRALLGVIVNHAGGFQ